MNIEFPEGFKINPDGKMYMDECKLGNYVEITVELFFGKRRKLLSSDKSIYYDDFVERLRERIKYRSTWVEQGIIRITISARKISSQDRMEIYNGILNNNIIDELKSYRINNKC